MHQLTLNMSDNAYTHLKYIIENIPEIEIEKDTHKQSNDDFEVNVEQCLKTLDKIKRGDTKDFKAIDNIDEHIEELINDIN